MPQSYLFQIISCSLHSTIYIFKISPQKNYIQNPMIQKVPQTQENSQQSIRSLTVFGQMAIIRIQNRNEDFAVNPLWHRGGSFSFSGVHLWFRGCRLYCLLFFKLTYITVLVKRFIQKHHSCHQDQQTTGQHHQ